MNLNGNTLNGIKYGNTYLREGTDYTVSGDTVTILKSFLNSFDTSTVQLIFDFSAGRDPVLTVNIIDTTTSASIVPTTADFDKNPDASRDVKVKLVPNGNTLLAVKKDGEALVLGRDYSIDGDEVTIFREYLADQPVGRVTLTFDFDRGTDPVLTINITDSRQVETGVIQIQMFNGNTSDKTNGIMRDTGLPIPEQLRLDYPMLKSVTTIPLTGKRIRTSGVTGPV